MISIPNHFYPINFRYEAFFSHPYLHRFFEIAGLVKFCNPTVQYCSINEQFWKYQTYNYLLINRIIPGIVFFVIQNKTPSYLWK